MAMTQAKRLPSLSLTLPFLHAKFTARLLHRFSPSKVISEAFKFRELPGKPANPLIEGSQDP